MIGGGHSVAMSRNNSAAADQAVGQVGDVVGPCRARGLRQPAHEVDHADAVTDGRIRGPAQESRQHGRCGGQDAPAQVRDLVVQLAERMGVGGGGAQQCGDVFRGAVVVVQLIPRDRGREFLGHPGDFFSGRDR